MSELKRTAESSVRTSLEVGFREGSLPVKYLPYRGRANRAIGAVKSFPFEDAQFEVVMMDGLAVNPASVREAHRVLRPSGRLYFTVPERTGSNPGMTLKDVYSLLRYGFNLVDVVQTPWFAFWVRNRTLEICAEKKNWRQLDHRYRPLV